MGDESIFLTNGTMYFLSTSFKSLVSTPSSLKSSFSFSIFFFFFICLFYFIFYFVFIYFILFLFFFFFFTCFCYSFFECPVKEFQQFFFLFEEEKNVSFTIFFVTVICYFHENFQHFEVFDQKLLNKQILFKKKKN